MVGDTDEIERVDVHEYDDRVTVVADIPGTSEADIDLQCDGRNLAIRASTRTQPFLVRIDLPAYVDDQSMDATYNNGVLEVDFDRARDPADIGFH